jgi:hypothetical protein
MVMKTHFLSSVVMGLIVGFAVLGCSEKVETEEKKEMVEEVDPFSGNITEVDPFSGNKAADEEQVAKVAEVDPDPVEAIIADKLHRMIIPKLDFEDRTVEEALDYIRVRIVELDQTDSDPPRKGVSMVIRRPKGEFDSKPIDENGEDLLGDGSGSRRIPELRMRNVSVAAALRYICIVTNLKCEVDECLVISQKVSDTAWDDVGSLLEDKGDTSVVSAKLSQIRLPNINFENITIYDAIDYLRLRSAEMHMGENDPKLKGINFVVYVPEGMEISVVDELRLRDVSIEEALKEICSKTGMRYELDSYSVILVPKDLK